LLLKERKTMDDLPHNHHFLAHIIAAAIREQERYEAGRGYIRDSAILASMKELRDDVAAGNRVVFNSRKESEREQMDAFAENG
jgi:hypothetical protein